MLNKTNNAKQKNKQNVLINILPNFAPRYISYEERECFLSLQSPLCFYFLFNFCLNFSLLYFVWVRIVHIATFLLALTIS